MEYAAVISLLAIGAALNQSKPSGVLFQQGSASRSSVPIPSTYESTRSIEVRHGEEARAAAVYKELRDPAAARIIAGPPDKLLPKTDWTDKTMPIEFSQKAFDVNETAVPAPSDLSHNDSTDFVTGGVHGISLTGQPINPKTFRHNNMVPFFGAKVKQNMDEYANSTRVEHFTGTPSTFQEKHEISPLFHPEKNIGNVYGASNLDGYMKDRYIPSRLRQGELPTEKIYVGPGLAAGYSACGKGGFHDFDSQEYAKPRNVDELRTLNNPKVSYYGRIVAGKHIARPAKIGIVQKNRPDAYYQNTPDRYFTTVGATAGASQRSSVVLKNMDHRKKSRSHVGPAGPAGGATRYTSGRTRFTESRKQAIDGTLGIAAAPGLWSALMSAFGGGDYGRSTTVAADTNREFVGHWGGADRTNGQNPGQMRDGTGPRRTRRVFLDENDHIGPATGPDAGPVWDPEDVAKTTIKEQLIDNDYLGPATTEIKDAPAQDMTPLRTTVKETTHSEHFGQAALNEDGAYQNENVEARETNRETCTGEVIAPAHRPTGGGYETTNTNINLTERSQYDDIAYVPGAQGPNEIPNSKQVNAIVRRTGDMKNDAIRSRGTAPTRVINSIRQTNVQSVTRTRTRLPIDQIAERTQDPSLLNAFRSNPYTQSLFSYVWP